MNLNWFLIDIFHSFFNYIARSTINNNAGSNNKKDIKESTDSNNVTIEDEEGKIDRISK